jgi:uncharacterized membrane protein
MKSMIILLVILIITFIFILGAGLVFLKMFSPKKTVSEPEPGEQPQPVEKPETKIRLRWSYFVLPLAILLVSVIIAIYFYGKLPAQVVWQLNSAGSPTVSRGQIVLWAIVPQVLLALLAFLIAYGATRIGDLFKEASASGIQLDSILMVMSNVVVIPQLILTFAILRIFSYNSFQTDINFVWWVSLAVIIVGIVVLSVFFIRALTKMAGRTPK